jgi:hypothetical protein
MEWLIASGVGLLGSLLAAEIIANGPRVARWFICRAARRLPDNARDRYREEWKAHSDELPGAIEKISHGMSCWCHAPGMAKALETPDQVQDRKVRNIRRLFQFLFALISIKNLIDSIRRGNFSAARSSWSTLWDGRFLTRFLSYTMAHEILVNKATPEKLEKRMHEVLERIRDAAELAQRDPKTFRRLIEERLSGNARFANHTDLDPDKIE